MVANCHYPSHTNSRFVRFEILKVADKCDSDIPQCLSESEVDLICHSLAISLLVLAPLPAGRVR